MALGPIAANLETAQRAAHFPWLARTLAIRAKGYVGETDAWTEAHVPPPVQRILKAQVAAGTTLDDAWGGAAIGDYKNTVVAFQDSLRTRSVFFRLLADSAFTRVPLQKRVAVTTAAASGWIVGEGRPTPLSRLSLANQMLTPIRSAALIVVSDELVNDLSASGQALFVRELKGAVSDATDQRFFDLVDVTDVEIISSGGDDAAAILTDLRSALMAIGVGSNGALYWIASQSVAKLLSTHPEQFGAASALGGQLLNLPLLVSSALAPGELVLLDAAGIAADAGTIEVRTSTQTDVEMSDTPTSDAAVGTGAMSVSMFQADSVAIMATVLFGCELLRSDAVVKITGMAEATA